MVGEAVQTVRLGFAHPAVVDVFVWARARGLCGILLLERQIGWHERIWMVHGGRSGAPRPAHVTYLLPLNYGVFNAPARAKTVKMRRKPEPPTSRRVSSGKRAMTAQVGFRLVKQSCKKDLSVFMMRAEARVGLSCGSARCDKKWWYDK